MPRDYFDDYFRELQKEFFDGKKQFLKDLRGQLEEDDDIAELIKRRITIKGKVAPKGRRLVVVTFDRRRNDNQFSYGYFDVLLVLIDALSGGQGIYKPINQLRVIHWNGFRTDLLRVLRFFTNQNLQIQARRILVLPYPSQQVGLRIDNNIYRR